jgi:hypothetical protein
MNSVSKFYSILFLSLYYNPIFHNYPVYNEFLLRKTLLDYENNSNPASTKKLQDLIPLK